MQSMLRGPKQARAACGRQAQAVAMPSQSGRPSPMMGPPPAALMRRAMTKIAASEAKSDTETYDVYVAEPQPLSEGVEKHTISVFVADEAGLINRVAGVFARRGANIESLAVGLNKDKALFTIVVTGTRNTVDNLVKQLRKLVKVRYVEDVTESSRIERELVMIKIRAPSGPTRTEILQVAEIFRARTVDVSDRCLTLAVTGDPGKVTAFLNSLTKFEVVELGRTGKIVLKRGEALLEGGSENEADMMPGDEMRPIVRISEQERTAGKGSGMDVYAADDAKGDEGVWMKKNVLDAAYDRESNLDSHTLSIVVRDLPGVLNQVTGVFARRGFNVQSLAVGPSEREGMSRIVMVVPGTGGSISNLLKQVVKLIAVESIVDLTGKPSVHRELMMIKIRCSPAQRREIKDLAEIFNGKVVDVGFNNVTVEITGRESKISAFMDLCAPFGVLEAVRTGRVAMPRDSGVDTRFLENMSRGKVSI